MSVDEAANDRRNYSCVALCPKEALSSSELKTKTEVGGKQQKGVKQPVCHLEQGFPDGEAVLFLVEKKAFSDFVLRFFMH